MEQVGKQLKAAISELEEKITDEVNKFCDDWGLDTDDIEMEYVSEFTLGQFDAHPDEQCSVRKGRVRARVNL